MNNRSARKPAPDKKIWIDLDNSPHVLFFSPIIKELKRRGYRVIVTARDFAQVCGLANMFNLEYQAIGRHYGKNKFMKVLGLFVRSAKLLPTIIKERPQLAFSHGSRSQILASKLTGVKSLEAFDYEYAKGLPLMKPSKAIVPEVLPANKIKMDTADLLRYPGIKEDVYIEDFQPDISVLETLGIAANEIVVTVRPPATHAHYHNPHAEKVFDAILSDVVTRDDTRIVILPRTPQQDADIRKVWAPYFDAGKIIIPPVVNGLNLLWHSDLAISGGGTMIREAAALNVPAYSIFAGHKGAVDSFLEDSGRLTFLASEADIKTKLKVQKRQRSQNDIKANKAVLQTIVDEVETMLAAA